MVTATMLSTLYHHLNLGWSGTATAWYALPLIDTGVLHFHRGGRLRLQRLHERQRRDYQRPGAGPDLAGRSPMPRSRPRAPAAALTRRPPTARAFTPSPGSPPASSYSITVTKANYSPVSGNFSTGTSSDWAATSGNYWGANFTMPMLTTALDHLVWGAVAATQCLNTPFAVTHHGPEPHERGGHRLHRPGRLERLCDRGRGPPARLSGT